MAIRFPTPQQRQIGSSAVGKQLKRERRREADQACFEGRSSAVLALVDDKIAAEQIEDAAIESQRML
jgi:hypothetical protein